LRSISRPRIKTHPDDGSGDGSPEVFVQRKQVRCVGLCLSGRVPELYATPLFDGPVISFDQTEPISLSPIQGPSYFPRNNS
jgi:hypothetical protein